MKEHWTLKADEASEMSVDEVS